MSSPPSTPAVEFVVNHRAKRYIMRVKRDGTLRVTIPRWGSRREAERFIQHQQAWIEMHRARLQAVARHGEWAHGTPVFWEGELFPLVLDPGEDGTTVASWGPHQFRLPARCSSTETRRLLLEQMRRLAEKSLPPRALALALQHGLTPSRISVRAQTSRWGSCSKRGTISLNWRLILCPDSVTDYVILHELAHLRELNHSVRFWQKVSVLCPEFAKAERWLKKHGHLIIQL